MNLRPNAAPTANAQTVPVTYNTAKMISLGATDPNGDFLNYSIVSGPAHGTLSALGDFGTISCSGTPSTCSIDVRYTPTTGYTGPDSFSFKVDDDTLTSTATVTLNVSAPANTAPVVDSVVISPTSPKTADLLTATPTAHDAEGNAFVYSYQWSKNGTDLPGRTSATLDLSGAGNGDRGDVLRVRVVATETASGGLSSAAVTSSPVTVGNTAPTLTSVSISPSSAGTNTLLTATPSGYSDADNDAAVYHYQWSKNGVDLAGATGATLDLSGSGNGGRGDVIAVAVYATDGNGGSSATRTSSLTVGNTAPTLTSVTISSATPATDSVVTATPSGYADADGDTAAYHYVWSRNGSVIPGETGATLDLALLGNGGRGDEISVAVHATDGNGGTSPTRTDSVTVVNTAPTADDDTDSTSEDTAVTVDVVANDDDLDGDDLSVVGDSISSTNGSATLDADGRIHFTPAANLNDDNVDVDGFTVLYRVTDGDLESGWATLTITVSASNDAPTADGESASTDEDTAVAKDVVANDDDLDGDDLSVVGDSISSTNGSATLDRGRSHHPLHAGAEQERRQRGPGWVHGVVQGVRWRPGVERGDADDQRGRRERRSDRGRTRARRRMRTPRWRWTSSPTTAMSTTRTPTCRWWRARSPRPTGSRRWMRTVGRSTSRRTRT